MSTVAQIRRNRVKAECQRRGISIDYRDGVYRLRSAAIDIRTTDLLHVLLKDLLNPGPRPDDKR